MDRLCQRCPSHVDGEHRTLCARCRRQAKAEALRAARPGRHLQIMLGIGGKVPVIPVIRPPVSVSPATACFHCGNVKQKLHMSVCDRCAHSLSRTAIEGYDAELRRRMIAARERGGSGVLCPQCGGALHASGGCMACPYIGPPHPSYANRPGPSPTMAYFPLGGASHLSAATRGFASGGIVPGGFRQPPTPKGPLEKVDADRAPDLMEHVLAWRGWNTTPDGHLVAAAQSGIWDPGENKAMCNKETHTDVPSVQCSCGFYGWHFPSDIAHGSIWGALKCRGEIIVHDVGIRAEYAEIVVVVDLGQEDAEMLARIVDRYKVPVVDNIEDAEKIAGEHGVRLPESMRPKRKDEMSDISGLVSALLAEGRAPPEVLAEVSRQTGHGLQEVAAQMHKLAAAGRVAGRNMAASMAQLQAALAPPSRSAHGPIQPLQSPPGVNAAASSPAAQMKAHLLSRPWIPPHVIPPEGVLPEPTGRERWIATLAMFFAPMAVWVAVVALFSAPAWAGLLVGAAIGYVAFISAAPNSVARFGRWLRCVVHLSHEGLWSKPPDALTKRGGRKDGRLKDWSGTLERGERCTYCGRRRGWIRLRATQVADFPPIEFALFCVVIPALMVWEIAKFLGEVVWFGFDVLRGKA